MNTICHTQNRTDSSSVTIRIKPCFYRHANRFAIITIIATQNPELVKRLNPEIGSKRLINLMTAWKHEIKELMGGMGINSIETLRGNRLMLRGIGITEKELEILGISHAGE